MSEKRTIKLTEEELKYIDPVLGQLSDGMWENSPRMNGYWMNTNIDFENKCLLMSNYTWWTDRAYNNPLYYKTDAEVKKWFAGKLKAVVKEYLRDHGYDEVEDWNRNNLTEVDYLDDGQTVAGAYKVYDLLMERKLK